MPQNHGTTAAAAAKPLRRHSTSHMAPLKHAATDLSGSLSASAIVGGTVTGHHLLHIDCYSRTKEELPIGQCFSSCRFSAGGRSWRIEYYPNGYESNAAEFISIVLCLDESVDQAVFKARVRFNLLDQAGEPVPSHTRVKTIHDFCTTLRFGYRNFIKRAWLEESEHLNDDCFTIRCDVIVTKELRAEERRPAFPLVVVPPSNLHQNFGDLLISEEGADVTFLVAGETFKAHRCILAARSPVFKAEVFGTMMESTSGSVIRVDDMDAQVFRALLYFVYTDAMPDLRDMKKQTDALPDLQDMKKQTDALPDLQDTKKQEEAAMAQHLLVAADRYDLERLKLICEDRLCGCIDKASAATILALSDQHHCCGLKEACFRFLSSPSALNAVITTDGFDHLTRSCPFVLKELMANIAARVPVDLEEA